MGACPAMIGGMRLYVNVYIYIYIFVSEKGLSKHDMLGASFFRQPQMFLCQPLLGRLTYCSKQLNQMACVEKHKCGFNRLQWGCCDKPEIINHP